MSSLDRVPGIGAEIENHLLELVLVAGGYSVGVGISNLYLDPVGTELSFDHGYGVVYRVVDVERLAELA